MSKKKKFGKKGNVNKKALSNAILGIFTNNPQKTFNYKQIAKQLFITDSPTRKLIVKVLNELVSSELLIEIYRGKFKLKSGAGFIIGQVDLTQAGYAYIIPEEGGEDVFVSQKNLHNALQGDTVKVYLYAREKRRQPEGEVVEILKRAKKLFVGEVEVLDRYAFLVGEGRQMPFDIFIPLEKLNGAKDGEKAVARITEWPKHAKNPFGEIVDVLGEPGEHDVEMHAILAEFDLPYIFPEEVNVAAESISEKITKEEIAKRRDFREVVTFTIDPDDAKDFDDALSFKKLDNGNFEVGVHIADVTHYVKPKTLIDQEGYARATSVYLVDRVVPMLPERLSNFICSLRPHEDKLCFSAVFELSDNAEVYDEWFGRSIINSNKRFTYKEAQNVIDTGKGPHKEEMITLNELAKKLRSERFKKGSIAFEREEVKFEIDEEGKPLRVFFREHGESNELIEEFMLLANKKVAEYIGKKEPGKKKKTFVYRVHDKPNLDKLESFNRFVLKFGHHISLGSNKKISETLNSLLLQVRGKAEQNVVETLALRAMAKAVYSTHNIGHYGLSFSHYTHFTSPIRRYPDITVHRLLVHYLNGGDSKNAQQHEFMSKHSSDMEQRAIEAERASVKYKQVEFMQDKVGVEFDGIISGVAQFGFFVEIIENKCEGLVSIRDLIDDFYEYDEDNYCIEGKRNGKKYQLGDTVKVKIVRTNLAKRQLDFVLVEQT